MDNKMYPKNVRSSTDNKSKIIRAIEIEFCVMMISCLHSVTDHMLLLFAFDGRHDRTATSLLLQVHKSCDRVKVCVRLSPNPTPTQ